MYGKYSQRKRKVSENFKVLESFHSLNSKIEEIMKAVESIYNPKDFMSVPKNSKIISEIVELIKEWYRQAIAYDAGLGRQKEISIPQDTLNLTTIKDHLLTLKGSAKKLNTSIFLIYTPLSLLFLLLRWSILKKSFQNSYFIIQYRR